MFLVNTNNKKNAGDSLESPAFHVILSVDVCTVVIKSDLITFNRDTRTISLISLAKPTRFTLVPY